MRLPSRRSGFKNASGGTAQRRKSSRYEPFPRRGSTHSRLAITAQGILAPSQDDERISFQRRQSGSRSMKTRERSGPFILPIPSPGPIAPDDYVRSPCPRRQRNSRRRPSRKNSSPSDQLFRPPTINPKSTIVSRQSRRRPSKNTIFDDSSLSTSHQHSFPQFDADGRTPRTGPMLAPTTLTEQFSIFGIGDSPAR